MTDIMHDKIASHLARNIRQLREARGLTQEQLSKSANVPRATLANLESGQSNPTVSVVAKIASAFQVSVEELISPPRAACQFYPGASLSQRVRGGVAVRRVLPDVLQNIELDRMELAPGSRLVGIPHRTGTREYFACEIGPVELTVAGESWTLESGDVVVFRGDQKHSYSNLGTNKAIAYSIVLLSPVPL